MTAFSPSTGPDPIRPDLTEQYQRVWHHIASPGTWLTGAERVAVAAETRHARSCALCAERKSALSPFSVDGSHERTEALPEALIDAVHRITTDAARLTESWYQGLLAEGLTAEAYVEALGVAVQVISIDEFHHALGLPSEPLPEPLPGQPSRRRPSGATQIEDAWVPVIPSADQLDAEDADLYGGMPGGRAAGVVRALSLVPDEVRSWQALSGAQYLSMEAMKSMESHRVLDRAQIELVAGRVSALNECFY
jgi:hypothetical protein